MYRCTKPFQTTNGVYYFLYETITENTYFRLTPSEKNNFTLIPREWEQTTNLADDRQAVDIINPE